MAPHLEVLGFVPLPEDIGKVGLVPDLEVETGCHAVVLNLSEQCGEELVVISPVSTVTGHGDLCRSIGTPQVCYQDLEASTVLACSLVVAESRIETILFFQTISTTAEN